MKARIFSVLCIIVLAGCAAQPVYTAMPSEPAPKTPTALCAGRWVSNGSQWVCEPAAPAVTYYAAPVNPYWYAYPYPYYGGFVFHFPVGRRGRW